jgi:hypothetical protein
MWVGNLYKLLQKNWITLVIRRLPQIYKLMQSLFQLMNSFSMMLN